MNKWRNGTVHAAPTEMQRSFASLRMTTVDDYGDSIGRGHPFAPLISSWAESFSMHYLDDEDFEDDIPIFSGRGEGIMEEAPATGSGAAHRNEDIALDLMKFVAMTTGYGRTASTGVGFQGTGSAAKPEDYATHLLELYGRCLGAVAGKK